MPRLLSRLSLWSSKCNECSGQPTPPPCYQCTFNLQHPPPNYTSLPPHLLIKTPSLEHSPCLEEEVEEEVEGEEDYNQDETLGLQDRSRNRVEVAQRYPGHEENPQPAGIRTVLTLTESLGRIALAMVSDDDRGQMMEEGEVDNDDNDNEEEEGEDRAPGGNTRVLSSSAPSESYLQRFNAAPLVALDDAPTPPSGSPAPPSLSTSPASHHLLLTALSTRFHDTTDLHHFTTSLSTPPSPRGASPLPCQLLVPE